MIGGDARAPQQIPRLTGDIDRGTAVVPFGQRHLDRREDAAVLATPQMERQHLPHRDLASHLGEPDLYRLGGRQGPTEEHPIAGVMQGIHETGLRRTEHAPGDAEARLGEAGERCFQTDRRAREQTRSRQQDLIKEKRTGRRSPQRELALDLAGLETFHAALDEEPADALVGQGPHHGDIGDRRIGDPHLRAVEHPVLAASAGRGVHVERIGPAMRLGQTETPDGLAARHRRQPTLALQIAAVGEDRVHAQRGLHRHEAAQRRITALEFLADEAIGDRVEPCATVALEGAAEQAQAGHRRDELPREVMVLEVPADLRQDLGIDEAGDRVADHALVVLKIVFDACDVVRGKCQVLLLLRDTLNRRPAGL